MPTKVKDIICQAGNCPLTAAYPEFIIASNRSCIDSSQITFEYNYEIYQESIQDKLIIKTNTLI